MRKKKEIYCNACGRKMERRGKFFTEDFISVQKEWGYFSKKDGTVQKFDLCEACMEKITEQFVIPVEETEKTELLQEHSACW
ncbi:MAG: hypothetical protein ACI4HI_17390 [Lachnospiraceae bacterium]